MGQRGWLDGPDGVGVTGFVTRISGVQTWGQVGASFGGSSGSGNGEGGGSSSGRSTEPRNEEGDDGGEKWSTLDFLMHYFAGGGEDVSLSEIGLDKVFEENWVTQEALDGFSNSLKLAMRQKGSEFEFSSRRFLPLQGRDSPSEAQSYSNPLFSRPLKTHTPL